MLRSKPIEGEEGTYSSNSYNLNDYTNSLKWDTLADEKIADMNEYYKGLIAFRKAHNALRMTTTAEIQANLHFMDTVDNVVAYTIENSPNGERAEKIMVVYNGNSTAEEVALPDGTWDVCINGQTAGTEVIETVEGSISVDGISALVLVQGNAAPSSAGNGIISTVLIIGAVVILAAGCAVFVIKRKKNK